MKSLKSLELGLVLGVEEFHGITGNSTFILPNVAGGISRIPRYTILQQHTYMPGVLGRFYVLNPKREMVVMEGNPWRSLLLKYTTVDSLSKGKYTGYTRDLHGQ